ncbi:MAG TPA: UDP-3-O-acyl-N-acetylglucosamine deacetylase, partial [Alphaproteobacteria bacterium]|nr:UDP-3-O-acyl-N-acetylglucosamine deacetylase [Alphaproteobacteria bacterium]
VSTIEHLMAALAGCGVDNAVVTVDAPEVPIMDGSSAPFVFLIECAGMAAQDEPRQVIEVLKRVEVRDGDRIASLAPSRDFRLSFEIDFASGAVRRQAWELRLRDGAFKSELARARTFGFLHEVEHLRSIGLAQGGSLDNAIVISGDRVLNEGGLRFRDEFVRHKILDAVGDLYCAGAPIRGHYHGHKAGHGITNLLLRALFADESAWRWADAVPAAPALTGGPVWDERLVAASA